MLATGGKISLLHRERRKTKSKGGKGITIVALSDDKKGASWRNKLREEHYLRSVVCLFAPSLRNKVNRTLPERVTKSFCSL